ncbi:MAG: PQQ-binding-like beta-propeller repeat protein [Phycisphaerales bacterium]|jgi:outer membrane protein assembly factor BamB|nr:PQQ-binding-like beta-propeller repeat protein [Phycisphaerales bacterium]
MSKQSTSVKTADLLFVGFNSRVAALDRYTGEVVWDWKAPKGTGYPAILLDGDRLLVSVQGYTYCLEPTRGDVVWENPLKGMGVGIACIATVRGSSSAAPAALAASAAAAAAVSTGVRTS